MCAGVDGVLCSSALYVKFMDDILSLQKRIQPVIVKYRQHIGMANVSNRDAL